MNRSILVAFFAILLPYCLLGAEPSAFGAGDLNNPQPYGLTSTEETLLENRKNLHKVVVKTKNQANEVDSLRERMDGLQTIIESISLSARDNQLKLKSLKKKNSKQLQSNNEYEKRLIQSIQTNSNLIQVNDNQIVVSTRETERLNLLLVELSKLVDTINSRYVTKDEFNMLINDVNKFKDLVAKELKEKAKPKKSKLDNISNSDIAKKAKDYYDKKLYTKALKNYNYLIKKNYKPARSHYMIGEINYYRKNYADALAYFKKSASLYSKASYMPVLMLHTAISMDKTGDKKKAKDFYNAVIAKYPQSDSARIAMDRLDLIK
ncbi:MAG: tetratricopeptide repeat protein [Sulfurimonas sp.]|nr:tetratricopeptide repeat protein [Sulfurimonas sp.]